MDDTLEEKGKNALSNKQHEQFCQNFVLHLNRYKAAIDVGYSDGPGLAKTVHQVMRRPEVEARLSYLQTNLAKETQIKREYFVQELSNHANADPRDIYDEHGQVKPLDQIPAAARRLITEIDRDAYVDKDGVEHVRTKIKVSNKAPYMKLLSDVLGFEAAKKVDHTSKGEKVPVVFIGVQDVAVEKKEGE